MAQKLTAFTLIAALGATAVLAHSGVTNPAVKARMEAMSTIGAATKTLGDMAKGAVPFDAAKAQAAAQEIADQAARVPALFAAPETDAKSEASPKIWDDFAGFTTQAEALETAAQNASVITSPDDLRASLGQIGKACGSCHQDYRISKN